MRTGEEDLSVLDRLQLALDVEALPAAAREHATHLIRRLSSPVRVACIGMPRSGKSELINMFLGQKLIPSDQRLPALEVVWGDTPSLTITRADGRVEDGDLGPLETEDLSRAAFLKIAVPADILKRLRFTEITPSGDRAEQRAAVDWAVRRTDIALWCSQTFGGPERNLWSMVPDSLKDHAFLVLTMADRLGAEGTLASRIETLTPIVAEEFHSFFPVATMHALAATRPDGTVDEAMRRASGGGNLVGEVLRHADRGRRADMDSAYVFLSRYQVQSPKFDLVAARTPSRPSPLEEISVDDEQSKPETLEVTSPEAQEIKASETTASNVALFEDGIRFLRRRGVGIAETAATCVAGQTRPVIDQCVDTVEHLVDLFSQSDTDDAVADAFIDELAEAAEMMVLMQVEDGDTPAADAVTLLLQLRRDMEVKLAA